MKAFISIRSGIFFLISVVLLTGVFACQLNHPPKRLIVEIKDMKFQPSKLIVQKGDTVIWINKDIVAHNVTEKNNAWASPLLPPDSTWKRVVEKSGSYYCSIHINMVGELIVESR
jgi:plastocyanin